MADESTAWSWRPDGHPEDPGQAACEWYMQAETYLCALHGLAPTEAARACGRGYGPRTILCNLEGRWYQEMRRTLDEDALQWLGLQHFAQKLLDAKGKRRAGAAAGSRYRHLLGTARHFQMEMVPTTARTDRGPEMRSAVTEEFLSICCCKHIFGAALTPRRQARQLFTSLKT